MFNCPNCRSLLVVPIQSDDPTVKRVLAEKPVAENEGRTGLAVAAQSEGVDVAIVDLEVPALFADHAMKPNLLTAGRLSRSERTTPRP